MVAIIPLPWDGGGSGRKNETLFNERDEIGWKVTEKINLKVIILKISVKVGVIIENKLRHSPCRFVKITMKINVEYSKIWSVVIY